MFLVVPFLLVYPVFGPYIFYSVCGPFYMQRHFSWSALFAPPYEFTNQSIVNHHRHSVIPTPFVITDGSCGHSHHSLHGIRLPCVESPRYPQPYPRDEHCSVNYSPSSTGGSLTAIDFSTTVGDTLAIVWDSGQCSNSATHDAILRYG